MHFAERSLLASAGLLLVCSSHPSGGALMAISGQRYAMGTMFDVVVYHTSKTEAERSIDRALDEAQRLDRVMSHFDPDSELARLHREGRGQAVRVHPSLYDVIRQSLEVSRRSRGKFDITVAPLVRLWKNAEADARRPDAEAIARAHACVGYDRIEVTAPDLIRLQSDCVTIDLGGIGKGYAVDGALAVLRHAGISHAVVNAGGSSIAAVGAPPGREGWPVLVGGKSRVLVLNGNSISTSLQDATAPFGHVIDPASGVPVPNNLAVTVVARSATLADALSTTLLVATIDEGKRLLAGFDGVAALWISPDGRVQATFGESHLAFAAAN